MNVTTITARDFSQSSGKARQAASCGPVVIMEHGRPAHVLMSFDLYSSLTASRGKIADLLAMAQDAEIEIPDFAHDLAKPANLD